ncbi:MAG: ABC transporter ATP-binding protein [Pirellulaceae bacterium]|nr:ABC transporter ATP-binding protein [Pirellulaceae bacterium]
MSLAEPEAVVSTHRLTVAFPGCEALREVDLQVPRGTVVALLGENGAGKTTLIQTLTGFLRPTAGSCRVLGLDPATSALEIRRRIGYVADAPALYDWMRAGEIGWFAASFYEAGYLERYREFIARYEVPEDRKIRHLSKGQRAKVALALALAHDPELLILDEPTSGLDPLVRREFLESMLERVASGRTVLLASHQISEVERVADCVAILHQGRVRLFDSLSHLRETVSEVTVSFEFAETELPQPAPPARMLREQVEGRQRKILVQGLGDDALAQWKSRPGVAGVRVRSAALDELFAACIRHGADFGSATAEVLSLGSSEVA